MAVVSDEPLMEPWLKVMDQEVRSLGARGWKSPPLGKGTLDNVGSKCNAHSTVYGWPARAGSGPFPKGLSPKVQPQIWPSDNEIWPMNTPLLSSAYLRHARSLRIIKDIELSAGHLIGS